MIMSNRSTTLVEFLAAVVADDARAVRLVGARPEIAQARVADERRIWQLPEPDEPPRHHCAAQTAQLADGIGGF